jgi:hypothetical protein
MDQRLGRRTWAGLNDNESNLRRGVLGQVLYAIEGLLESQTRAERRTCVQNIYLTVGTKKWSPGDSRCTWPFTRSTTDSGWHDSTTKTWVQLAVDSSSLILFGFSSTCTN